MDNRNVIVGQTERLAAKRLAQALRLPAFESGWVWLAGAGPGDPGLVTMLGLHAITEADVILYDALVDESLLNLARPAAELFFAGKRRGNASCKQSDISRTLVSLARKGLRVLRLKGGDPFVFGRGGEEALALASARIPFRIVPGVTAGIGGLAYAGIPVTHRGLNHTVTFVTGHGSDGRLPELDWRALSQGSPTLVFYMALARADEIAARLMAAGRAPEEPAAIIGAAATVDQKVQITTLAHLGAAAQSVTAPAMLVVGPNVELRESLDWLGAWKDGKTLTPLPPERLREVS